MTTLTPLAGAQANSPAVKSLYLLAWRWHFYAGVLVVPFMLILALSGLALVFAPQLEQLQYRHLLSVPAQAQSLSLEQQKSAVMRRFPDAVLQKVRPAQSSTASTEFAVQRGGQDWSVYVNPHTGELLGELNYAQKWATIAEKIHGTLLIGDTGDRLLEIAAGWGIVLTVTGLYLWWPRRQRPQVLPQASPGRAGWKNLHAVSGFWFSGVLIFFLLTGLAWAGIWGGKFVQAWNTFPAQLWQQVPQSRQGAGQDPDHRSTHHHPTTEQLNRPGEKSVPWGLEQSALPQSGHQAGALGITGSVNLDSVGAFAHERLARFWIAVPADLKGVYTISASTMSGDLTDARHDRTIHLDQYSGHVLADIGWGQYSAGAKAMAAGIALHQGRYGLWNQLAAALSCLVIGFLCISGVVMWWKRRPRGPFRLAPPPVPAGTRWVGGTALMLLLSLAFPLVALSLLIAVVLDFALIRRIPALRRVFL